jgi:hypothetical protein
MANSYPINCFDNHLLTYCPKIEYLCRPKENLFWAEQGKPNVLAKLFCGIASSRKVEANFLLRNQRF